MCVICTEKNHREEKNVKSGKYRCTSCFICLDSAALLMLNNNRFTCLVELKQEVSQTVILLL